jgi:hypothetical protein
VKRSTKVSLKRAGGVVVLIFGLRLAVPVPLEGNWTGGMSDCLCGDGHQFTRFANGQVVFFNEGAIPKPSGTYRKIGWNKFLWEGGPSPKPIQIQTGWLFNRYHLESDGAVYRDFRDLMFWKTARIMRNTIARA